MEGGGGGGDRENASKNVDLQYMKEEHFDLVRDKIKRTTPAN